MKKIGLFGGSFDPIHKAHIEIALFARKQLNLDEVQLIPTKNNPWKDMNCASREDRLNMIHIAIDEYPDITVNSIEIDSSHNQKNYTIDTIKQLQKENHDVEYYYIMGMDQANLFDEWKNAQEISERVHLVAFQRGGYLADHKKLEKFQFIVLNNEPIDASSSAVRDGQIELLNHNVLKYISTHGIYLESMIKKRMKEKRWKHSCSVAHLAKDIAKANHLNEQQAYIAGILHDVAKEMAHDKALHLMQEYYPQYVDKPEPIWHQWLSRYVCENEFLVEDEVVLKAIEDHTTASIGISAIGKCVYVADKLDPLRGYDSSKQIEICKQDIHQGFRDSLIEFYEFSTKKGRHIDECFYEIYNYYVTKGEI